MFFSVRVPGVLFRCFLLSFLEFGYDLFGILGHLSGNCCRNLCSQSGSNYYTPLVCFLKVFSIAISVVLRVLFRLIWGTFNKFAVDFNWFCVYLQDVSPMSSF